MTLTQPLGDLLEVIYANRKTRTNTKRRFLLCVAGSIVFVVGGLLENPKRVESARRGRVLRVNAANARMETPRHEPGSEGEGGGGGRRD